MPLNTVDLQDPEVQERLKLKYPVLCAHHFGGLEEMLEEETQGLLRATSAYSPGRMKQLVAARLFNGALIEEAFLLEDYLYHDADYTFALALNISNGPYASHRHDLPYRLRCLSRHNIFDFYRDVKGIREMTIMLPKPIYEEE